MAWPKSTKSIVVTKSEEDNPSSRFRQTCCTGRHRPSLDGAQEERHGPACLPERRHARVGEGRHAPLLPVPACYLLRNDAPALVGTACGQTALCAARPRLAGLGKQLIFAQVFGFESFFSGIGGFVGIFLGFSIMQLAPILGNGIYLDT